jgi:hypothetical protein
MYQNNSTIWTFDFQNDLIFFSSGLEHTQYTVVVENDDNDDDSNSPLFFQIIARRRRRRSYTMIVDVLTSEPVNATVTMTVEQAV